MADGEVLKRLGGGRWKTADDRFSIEPQSGSWVVVDADQSDELGLPIVRGPFPSLTAARAAIESARAEAPPVSPLAERLEQERRDPRPARAVPSVRPKVPASPAVPAAPTVASRPAKPGRPQAPPPSPPSPPPPPEPAWIGELPAARRKVARTLIRRLEDAGVTDAMEVARLEVADDQPAVAAVALERRLRAFRRRHAGSGEIIDPLVDLLIAGEDPELEVEWRLVDGRGRTLRLPGRQKGPEPGS